MLRALPHLLALAIPLVAGLCIRLGGGWVYAPLVIFLGLVPMVDLAAGRSHTNPDNRARASLPRRLLYEATLWAYAPVHLWVLWTSLRWLVEHPLPWPYMVGAVASLGLASGAGGITAAHELMHRFGPAGRPARAVAEVLMSAACYPHFCVEHVFGHHKHVATRRDPATARYGEGLYAFWLRTLVGSVRSARAIEGERVARAGIPRWSLANRNVRHPLLVATLAAIVGIALGPVGLLAFLGHALVAVLFLETINYIEHYGLVRQEIEPGRHERPQAHHSWNASERLTNWLLYNLQRHSDHHDRASVPFRDLKHLDQAPQLPTGYAGMLWIAAVPPLWRRVMDPRVAAWRARWFVD